MLRVGSNVVIDGLSERADLNGSIGVITSYSNEQQRWIIMVDGEPKKLAMKPSRLAARPEPGRGLRRRRRGVRRIPG